MKTKIEIVSGFLGSGKTSFINSYLDTDICLEEKILVILLEKGVQNIRNDLNNIKVIYINKLEELKDTLLIEAKKQGYEKVIIEFNGTSNLSLVGEIFKDKQVRKIFNFYGSYYIGDSKNLDIYIKNLGELIIPFIQSSKLIILNNFYLLQVEKQKILIKNIEDINSIAPILLSKNIDNLQKELKLSKYFKDGMSIKKIKSLINKKEVVR